MNNKAAIQMLDALERGHASFPVLFFMRYHDLGLTDQEAMLLLHILAHQQTEARFPDLELLANRMGLTKEEIAGILQRCTLSGVIHHEGQLLSIRPLLERMVGLGDSKPDALSIFHQFESEFGRLLSPLEQEQIARWLDEDGYPEWMILEALRESVLSGVYKFRYVDTVLREWSRSKIQTKRELAEHLKQYRQKPASPDHRTRTGGQSRSAGSKGNNQREDPPTRVIPAAQPGKYERFYQLYKNRDETAATGETK